MLELYDPITSWSTRTGFLLLNHLWQSTLFALALLPAAFLLRRAPARLRYRLSLLVSAKFLLPSALSFVLLARLVPGIKVLPASSFLSFDLGRLLGLLPWPVAPAGGGDVLVPLLTAVWLAGAGASAGLWWWRQRAFARRLAAAPVMVAGPEVELLDRARGRLGLRRPVGLVLLPDSAGPGVWGVFRPLLVVPEEMPAHLSPEELEAIFLHELIHVRRRDNLVASLHRLLCCLFWFHPLVWLLERRLLAEREEACDEGVLELTGGASSYLRSLLKAVRFGVGWRLAGISSARASDLGRRLERIRTGTARRRPSPLQRGLVGVVAALLVAFTVAAGASAWVGVPGCRGEGEGKGDRCLRARSAPAAARPGCDRTASAAPLAPRAPATKG